jgi:hypothetical protein
LTITAARVDQLRQHCDDALEQFEPTAVVLVVDQLFDSHHVEVAMPSGNAAARTTRQRLQAAHA